MPKKFNLQKDNFSSERSVDIENNTVNHATKNATVNLLYDFSTSDILSKIFQKFTFNSIIF